MLKVPRIAPDKLVDLFIGVVSAANNFKRRMAVRRTWMQHEEVRSARAVVRFFVGLHKNGVVNEELWNEAITYRDIQILPFVDYYELLISKTIAICIYRIAAPYARQTGGVSARYVMKTDDDAFVRVDSILSALKNINITSGLLYGRINDEFGPDRNNKASGA
ncbi:Beta-1,3-galactosyltransferase 15 [Carex littledalei]|uniref:Hexosyltransferase n=1 Tax=Carex littledalei TaxID=544730 RepID=A0A833QYH3_9POAL|nr:Beta-1,3-galactosyltransferase 15 [Carex littledalei]